MKKKSKIKGSDWNTFIKRRSGPMRHRNDRRKSRKQKNFMEGW